ncbi:MAG: lamin tail domain-containing protein, partial [Deltaproteobacteria bacterium]|nr:lamin tail domain-containing protein [Deltaproteobacteria bacterium]
DTGDTEEPDPDCAVVDPFPATLSDTSGLSTRYGSIGFQARDGNAITAYTYRATGFDGTGPILFVMHGSGRTASSYLDAFEPIAERHGALAIAPRFPTSLYPSSENYTLGVGVIGTPSGGNYIPAAWRDPEDYLYAELEHLFEAVKTALGSPQCSYRVFGHSAGGQFTHRLLTFLPYARVHRAVAANSGWYTLPSDGGGADPNYFMPYGLQGSPVNNTLVGVAMGRELVVLLGEEDTATAAEDSSLRGTPEANYQGVNRLERGQFYYALAQSRAVAFGADFQWRSDVVPGAGHDKDEMAASAGWYLFREDGAVPCTSTAAVDATGLVINEILADPPSELAGDANADGVRDSNADEFVELVNTGGRDLCLAGWTLSDADEPQRHRFPLGTLLPAGEALVVFGGGVPTGDFGDSNIQWAAFGGRINMNNAGDVVTLADRFGVVHAQVSWGDCDGAPCATDHRVADLEIDQSIVRDPELIGPWTPHSDVQAGSAYSPGLRADGTGF